jgi:DNA-binding transcriptional regulator LsrR (DeoR family)
MLAKGDEAATRRPPHSERLEQAARAAWLYYVGGRTQDEIAAALDISRQGAQRLVSLAVAEKLIKFRIDHPIAACMALAEEIAGRYGLRLCEVVPSGHASGALASVAVAGAAMLERWLAQDAPMTLAVSTGRTLRAIAAELPRMHSARHTVFSLCGIIGPDGRAIAAEPVVQIAERTGAQCFPMPLPVITASVAECRQLQSQRAYQTLHELFEKDHSTLVGIGHIGPQCPIHASHLVTDAELAALVSAGAVGEIAGRAFDAAGRPLEGGTNARVTGLPMRPRPNGLTMAVGAGAEKVSAIRAAMAGALINALITDEATAAAILGEGRSDLTEPLRF